MKNGRSILCFIPARGGSKGVPNKNILDLNGKPLIAYTIQAAKQSGVCDEIMVSTDSRKIANISNKFGAEIPFLRPDNLAKDNSEMIDVIIHTLEWYNNKNKNFDIFLYLQPTSPLRSYQHIKDALNYFFSKKADSVVSVNKSKCLKERINTLPQDKNMLNFVPTDSEYKNRQELTTNYEVNGAICISTWKSLKKNKSWYVKKSFGYVIDEPYCLDIDEKLDFDFAEFLLKKGYGK